MRQVFAREGNELLLAELVPVFEGDKGTRDLPPLLVRLGHHLILGGGCCVVWGKEGRVGLVTPQTRDPSRTRIDIIICDRKVVKKTLTHTQNQNKEGRCLQRPRRWQGAGAARSRPRSTRCSHRRWVCWGEQVCLFVGVIGLVCVSMHGAWCSRFGPACVSLRRPTHRSPIHTPHLMMISLLRSLIWMRPFLCCTARSPVWNHPPANASSVAFSFCRVIQGTHGDDHVGSAPASLPTPHTYTTTNHHTHLEVAAHDNIAPQEYLPLRLPVCGHGLERLWVGHHAPVQARVH